MSSNTGVSAVNLAKRYIVDSWSSDESIRNKTIDELVAKDVVSTGPMTEDFQGREGYRAFVNTFLNAFKVSIKLGETTESADGWVTTIATYTGKNEGEFFGKPATNRTITVVVSISLMFNNKGKILASHIDWDPEKMMADLYN